MKLVSLRVHRLPGIDGGFECRSLSPGVNVVVGPNASGKSSVLRAIRALLYEEELKGQGVIVEGVFEDGAGRLAAERVADRLTWHRDGKATQPPALPGRHLLDCYVLGLEDLTAAQDVDRPIVEALRKSLAGGYDVQQVLDRAPYRLKATHGRPEARRLQDAEQQLRQVQNSRDELRRKEEQIRHWRIQEQAAEAAQRDADAHGLALALLHARRKVRALEEALAGFPTGMDRLTGDEDRRLERLQDAEQTRLGELAEARRKAADAEGELAASGLADSALRQADLDERAALVRELRGWEEEAAKHRETAAAARAARDRAWAALQTPPGPEAAAGAARRADPDGPGPQLDAPGPRLDAPGPRLDPATLHAVEAGLDERRAARARVQAYEQELASLPEAEGGGGAAADPARLRAGRDALVAFLTAAAPVGPARIGGAALALAATAAALVLLARAGTGWPPLAAIGGAALIGLGLSRLAGRGRRERAAAREAYRRSGLEPLARWTADVVRDDLTSVEEALSTAELLARRLERRSEVERLLNAERDRLAVVEERLEAEARRVGFDPRHLDAGFHQWLRLLDEAQRSGGELAAARARLAPLEAAIGPRREALAAFLADHGEPPEDAATGAAALEARLAALQRRLTQRIEASRDLASARRDEKRAVGDLEQARSDIAALLRDAGVLPDGSAGAGSAEAPEQAAGAAEAALGDVGAADEAAIRAAALLLRQRLELRDAFRARKREHDDAVTEARLRAQDLGDRPELIAAAEAEEEEAIESRRGELEKQAAEGRGFTERIAETRGLIQEAERQRSYERALAERQQVAKALQDRVEEALYAEAGRLLLSDAERAYRRESEPPALAHASEWLRRFTHGQFEIHFDGRGEGYAAFDTAAERVRSLDELSTGTRAQLLLAVRVAFALQAERGGTSLPLFLDEALTTSDASRFREVARSLGALAADGRQLFYLTARGEDARLWQELANADVEASAAAAGDASGAPAPAEVAIVDMARLRALDAAVDEAEALEPVTDPPIPPPDGMEAGAYAVALGVPGIDPWAPAGSCHLFHLLRDDLALLHRLLQAGVRRLGPLRSFLASEAASTLLSDPERATLRRRAESVTAYLSAWRIGRGRPVDRAALDASGVLTDKMLERVAALADEVGGDGGALVEGLDNKRVANFQSAKRQELREWLSERGHLDDRPQLTRSELARTVFEALSRTPSAQAEKEPEATLEEATQLAAWLDAGVNAAHHSRTSLSESSSNPSFW